MAEDIVSRFEQDTRFRAMDLTVSLLNSSANKNIDEMLISNLYKLLYGLMKGTR